MIEPVALLVFTALSSLCGYFLGYANAMRYCTKRLKELAP